MFTLRKPLQISRFPSFIARARWRDPWVDYTVAPMQRVFITGANRGIGLELCKELKARGDEVVALCRRSSGGLDALGLKIETGVDVTSAESMDAIAKKYKGQHFDLLINCAGILESMSLDTLDLDSVRRQFEVNAIGPLLVTNALLPLLNKGSKVAIITSRMGSIADNDSGGSYGYRMSKCAVNMAGKSLAIDLRERGIAVALLHPGWVRTEMTGHTGLLDADESAKTLLARMDAFDLAESGSFWHQNGEALPW